MATSSAYFRKRTSIANTPFMSVTNAGTNANWNVNAGSQSNVAPTGLITTDAQMGVAVQSLFYKRATRLASTRHGAIYDVRANLTHLHAVLSQDANRAAYVSGPKAFPSTATANVLITVAHMPSAKPTSWNQWLRYRVREAKMHRVLYDKIAATHRSSQCSPVPMLHFAGVDHTTGLYFVVMQRPSGTLAPLSVVEAKGALSLGTYRTIEAAIGSLWFVGAMLSDTSAGNILVTSRNHVVIADYDSALVIPPGLKDRLYSQLYALYTSRPQGSCRTLKNTQDRDLVILWDFVMRESSNRPSLQRLAVDVYGRRRWFPDVELLRTLKIASRNTRAPSRLRETLAEALRSGRGMRMGGGGLRELLRGRERNDNNGDSGSTFLNVRLRKIGALPEEEKSVWRRRQRRPKESRRRTQRHSTSPSALTNANLPVPNRPRANNVTTTNNNNNRVPMPSSQRSNGRNNANAPRLSNGMTNLVAPVNTSIFQQGLNLGTTPAKNNTNATKKFTSTRAEFAKYSKLDIDHQTHLVDVEVDRYSKTRDFKEFEKKLAGGASYDGSPALNSAIQKMKPDMGWKLMGNADRKTERKDTLKAIARSMLRDSLQYVLVKNLPSADDRDKLLRKALDKSAVAMGWVDWAASLKKRVWG